MLGLYPMGLGKKVTATPAQQTPSFSPITVTLPTYDWALEQGRTHYFLKFTLGYVPADIQTKEGKTDFLFLEDFANSCPKAYARAQRGMQSMESIYQPNITSTVKKLNDLGYNSKELFNIDSWTLPAISDIFDVFRSHLWQFGK